MSLKKADWLSDEFNRILILAMLRDEENYKVPKLRPPSKLKHGLGDSSQRQNFSLISFICW